MTDDTPHRPREGDGRPGGAMLPGDRQSESGLSSGSDRLSLFDQDIRFAEIINTTQDSPVLLSRLLEPGDAPLEDTPVLAIVDINGVTIEQGHPTPLPGIRVGAGEGSGYVLQREFDGQFIFIPDASYTGVTTFTYTVADAAGEVAAYVATLCVNPQDETETSISFADGSHIASVSEGADAAIIGALDVEGLERDDGFVIMHVYEGLSDVPSLRFLVSGDTLHSAAPLDHAIDGTIPLRIVATDYTGALASSEFAIEVRPSHPIHAPAGTAPLRPTLVYSASMSLDEQTARDQFHFQPAAEASRPAGDWTEFDSLDDGMPATGVESDARQLHEPVASQHPPAVLGEQFTGPPADSSDFGDL